MRCVHCNHIYIAEILDNDAIIEDGPPDGSMAASKYESTNLKDIADSWELAYLPGKLAEADVARQNALDALAIIHQYRRPPGRLLDFGCGWGFFLSAAKEAGWEPYGLEPLPGHATYARSQLRATVVTDTLRPDTFDREFFDVVTAFQVFEHLPDPAGDLLKLQAMIKPGGVVFIEVPNIDTWTVKLLGKHHRHFVCDHINFFSLDTLAQLCERAGFEVVARNNVARKMSVRHLMTVWGNRYLPESITQNAVSRLEQTKLWEQTLRLNIGDIIAVTARKRG